MAYTIRRSDGQTVTINDDTTDTIFNPSANGGIGTGIQLVGRNKLDYGAPIAQDFLRITENFASSTGTQPQGKYAAQGQLWYDKSIKNLYMRITEGGSGTTDTGTFAQNWQQIITVGGSGTSALPIINPGSGTEKDGDIKIVGGTISMWTSTPAPPNWRQIYPALPGPAVYS